MRGVCAAVELADHHRAVAAIVHDARLQIVGAEIDEAADRALLADDIGDDQLVQPVLRRDHDAVIGKMRQQRLSGGTRVLRLHAEEYPVERALEIGRQESRSLDRVLEDRPGDPQARRVDRRDMTCLAVDEDDGMAGADEGGAERAADRARAPDQDRLAHAHGPSSSARVSSTAISQIACMSSSGRS